MYSRLSAYLLLSGCLLFATFFTLSLAQSPGSRSLFSDRATRAEGSIAHSVALRTNPVSKTTLQGSYHYADGRILLNLKPRQDQKVQVLVSRLSGKAVYFKQWEVHQSNFREEINLAHLPEGMYLIDIRSGSEKMSQMLIK